MCVTANTLEQVLFTETVPCTIAVSGLAIPSVRTSWAILQCTLSFTIVCLL
jgi:hypothetical protein